jgi:hypothetical protein
MGLVDWTKLLIENRFAVHPARWPMSMLISMVAVGNSVTGLAQKAVYGRKLAATKLAAPPIFVLGHWRSGTTFLHELFMHDEQFATPSTCQCFAAHHFLLTGAMISRWLGFLLPSRRPMDNVAAGWDRPQEDEFALMLLGARSPYRTMAFPNRPPQCQEYLDFDGVSPADVAAWKSKLDYFLKAITLQTGKPIVLKSPPHTGRIRVLLEMFPDAKFVHIVRDPFVVFPSTLRLWSSMYETQGLQLPKLKGLEEYVLSSFERMYAAFERDRPLARPDQIIDVRYESLAANPLEEMRTIYQRLNLSGFAAIEEKLQAQTRSQKEYRTNRYSLEEPIRNQIAQRWRAFIEKYGYGESSSAVG